MTEAKGISDDAWVIFSGISTVVVGIVTHRAWIVLSPVLQTRQSYDHLVKDFLWSGSLS